MKVRISADIPNMILNDNGLYCCPICNSVAGKIHNYYPHENDEYTLQCPNYREHCNRKNRISAYEASPYKPISIQRCSICNAVLSYIDDMDEYKLVCPNDKLHQKPIKTSSYEIEKVGYSSIL